uniref:UMA domain-containing protein n=1 Tax=Tabanus bromius TaxID=304241 RepID=A0A0K8TNX0_TABBR
MFSFFGKKKSSSPAHHEEEAIQGPDANHTSDGFTVIGNTPPNPSPYPQQPAAGMNMRYPAFPSAGGIAVPNYFQHKTPPQQPIHYLQGIPFQLAPELESDDPMSSMQMEIDGVLAIMTKTLQLDCEHDFAVERSVLFN